MLHFTSGEDITVPVAFTRGGEPFVPDALNLVWYLRDQTGTAGGTTSLTCTNTYADILVLAAQNALPGGQRFTKRFVCVSGTHGGKPFTIVVPYTLAPWKNFTVTAQEVRDFIGVDAGELDDNSIDLLDAYFAVVDSVGDETILATALASGLKAETQANTAIRMKAALMVLPSLQLRLSQAESDGSLTLERLKDLDLAGTAKLARLNYGAVMTALSGRTTQERVAFIVTTPTDPVTGV